MSLSTNPRAMSWLRRALVMAAITMGLSVVVAGPGQADTAFQPPAGTWNQKAVYLSRACHDGGIPGGPCNTNNGCGSYDENSESVAMSNTATYGSGDGTNLLERGYRVVIGNGTLNQNVANSNSRNIAAHIPLHSNAQGSGSCGGPTGAASNGTWGLYKPSRPGQVNCSNILVSKVGGLSPGTADKQVAQNGLGELNNVDAAVCYSEAEFHTWNAGVNWLTDEVNWTHRIGATVDAYLGFP